ncbi:MAG: hypothetical protein NZM00_12090 [Anaerolinea sp.]|nr:hypothetical protein [Anaerolinea sp.]
MNANPRRRDPEENNARPAGEAHATGVMAARGDHLRRAPGEMHDRDEVP